MREFLKIAALVFWLSSKVNGEEPIDQFIVHIIETWKVLSPTIVYNGDMPESCYALNFVLCLHNENENKEELVELLTHMHLDGKQDGIIFVGPQGHELLLRKLPINTHVYTSKSERRYGQYNHTHGNMGMFVL